MKWMDHSVRMKDNTTFSTETEDNFFALLHEYIKSMKNNELLSNEQKNINAKYEAILPTEVVK